MVYQFKPIDEINLATYKMVDKSLIKNGDWATLPKAAKAVFQPIFVFQGKDRTSFLNEETVAALAGLTPKQARDGMNGLESFPAIESIDRGYSGRGRVSKTFTLAKPPTGRGSRFPLHRCVYESGVFSRLIPSAKALLPVIRCFSYVDADLFSLLEDEGISCMDFRDWFPQRNWEIFDGDMDCLSEHAGIHSDSLKPALASLEANGLANRITYGHIAGFVVYFRPLSLSSNFRKITGD